MRKLLAFSLLCFVLPSLSVAQTYDPQYIEVIPSSFTIRPYYSVEAGRWTISSNDSPSDIIYRSEDVHKAGVTFAMGGLSAGYGVAVKNGFNMKDENLYGRSEAFDFFTHYYGRQYGFELSFSHNKGFYINNPEDLGLSSPDGSRPQFPDMKSDFVSVSVVRVMNYREFSLNAPYDQGERQKRSAGTWYWIGSVYLGRLNSPTPIIPAQIDSRFSDLKGLTETSFTGFSVSPGRSQTFVPIKNCYISGAASVGLGGQYQVSHTDAGRKAYIVLAGTLQLRLALGWTGERMFAGIYSILDIYNAPTQHAAQNAILNQNQLFVGMNF